MLFKARGSGNYTSPCIFSHHRVKMRRRWRSLCSVSALVATVIISYNLICFHYNFVIFIQVHFLVVVLIINELLSFSLFLTILHRLQLM